jgi:hypothetical protein
MTDDVQLRKLAKVGAGRAAIFLRNIIGKRDIEIGKSDPPSAFN